jgi:hypothetical protein
MHDRETFVLGGGGGSRFQFAALITMQSPYPLSLSFPLLLPALPSLISLSLFSFF